MTELLKQDEIEALLDAISSEYDSEEDYGKGQKIMIHDFKRPEKFTKHQIGTFQMMHETFARLSTMGLSAQLRTFVAVDVASVDQMTYEEFIRSIPNPSTLAVINMDPLQGSALLEVDPSITIPMIDRLMGGMGDPIKINREHTDIEISLLEGIIVGLLGKLREAWSYIIDLRPRLGNIETKTHFVQIVHPNEMVILVTLETKIGEVQGMMYLCIPFSTIDPIAKKFTPEFIYESYHTVHGTGDQKNTQNLLLGVQSSFQCGELTINELFALKKGDTLPVRTDVGKPFYRTIIPNTSEAQNG